MIRFFFLGAIFFSIPAFAISPLKLAITWNENGSSTSTSNPGEGHIRKGAELALREIPARLKETAWINNGESVPQSIEAINQINQQKPLIVVGMGNSFQALLAAQRMNAASVLISPVATSDEILAQKANVLLLSNLNSRQAKLLTSEIRNHWKPSQRVLLLELGGCPYCSDMSIAVRQQLKQINIEPVNIKIHNSQIAEASEVLKSQKGFSHIILPVFEADAARLISLLYPENTAAIFWGGDGWGTLARYVQELPFARRLQAMWLSHYHSTISTTENRNFVRKFRLAFSTEPVDTSAFFYEATQVALKLGKETTSKTIIRAFKHLGSYRGLTGEVKIMGQHVNRSMPLMKLTDGYPQMVKMIGTSK